MKPAPLARYSMILLLPVLLLCGGCNTLRSGGSPKPTTSFADDYKEIERNLQRDASLEEFYKQSTPEARNRFISARLILINLRYIEFLKAANAERQALDTAHDFMVMGLGVAGAALTPASTKTVLAAASAGISGSKSTFDKNYYYEKTVPALVAAMNAKRSEALIPILRGMQRPLSEYGIGHAVADLQVYYEAGTYLGAIQAIQVEAGVRNAAAIQEIRSIPKTVTAQNIELKLALNPIVIGMTQEREADWRLIYKEVFGLEGNSDFGKFKEEFFDTFKRAIVSKHEDLAGALKAKGLFNY